MDKTETPEDAEILKFLNNLADHCIPMDGGKMRMTAQVWPIVKARDALIRSDERRKAADKFREVFCQKCEQYGLHDRVNDPCPELARLRAAIMSEPEEAQG